MTSVSLCDRKRWPRATSPLAQLLEVVDLAVEDDLDGAVLVRHRLAGVRRQIDDPQPAEPEAAAPPGETIDADAVRTAMHEPIAHRDQLGPRSPARRRTSAHRRCRTSP